MTDPSAPGPNGQHPWGAPPQQNISEPSNGPPQGQGGWGTPHGQQPGQPQSPSPWPQQGAPQHGAPQHGAPHQGAPQQPGWAPPGQPPQGPPPQGWSPPGPPPQGYPQQGYPQQGYGHHPPMPQPQQTLVYPNNPNPGIAAVASFFFPGVGQIILGQTVKGAVLLGVSLFTGYMCGLMSIVGAIDAWQVGKKLESGRPVGEWEFF